MGTLTVMGVDGWRGGWIGARMTGTEITWELLADASAVCASQADAIAVDIPIGLPTGARRRCDVEASRLLRPGGSSRVFPTPPRAVLAAVDYLDACALSFADCGKKLSKQTWGIWPKIRDFELTPRDDDRVVEAHPEVSFLRLSGRILSSKHHPAGLAERMAVLGEHFDVPRALTAVPKGVGLDDALDALACAWTAARWAWKEAEVLGGEVDALGVPMRIVV